MTSTTMGHGFASIAAQVASVKLHRAAELPEGLAAIEGRAAGSTLLASPVSGVQVLAYRIVVSFPEAPSFDYVEAVDFEIVDASGRATVATTGARMVLCHEYTLRDEDVPSATVEVHRLLARVGGPELQRRVPEGFAWHEYYLQPGEPAFVCGYVRRAASHERPRHYRDNAYLPTFCPPPEGRGELIVADLRRAELLRVLDR